MDDVIVIGAGVVGCMTARELSRWNLKVAVLEAGSDVAEGASKANSAIVHAGFDAKPGTNKAKFNVLGNKMFENACKELKVPFKRNGSLVLAFNDEEIKGLTFGDNDQLSALIARLVCADALMLLTTVDGLLDGSGRRVSEIVSVKEAFKLVKAGQKGALSKGGMDSKLKAVKTASEAGANVVIANGRRSGILQAIFAGRDVGTFVPGRAL